MSQDEDDISDLSSPVKERAQWLWLTFHSLSWESVEADTMSSLFRNLT